MTVRSAFAAAAVAASIAAFSAPASAQEVRTFDAWGHTFNVPGSQSVEFVAIAARNDVVTTGSVAPKRAYASVKAGAAAESASVADQVIRAISVWGAQVNAPAY